MPFKRDYNLQLVHMLMMTMLMMMMMTMLMMMMVVVVGEFSQFPSPTELLMLIAS